MLRAVLVFLGLAALGVAAAWLADHPGLISMEWGGRRIETSTAVAATAVLILLIIVAALYRFWRWLATSPMALSHLRAEGRRRKGYQSLSSGLVAVAAVEELVLVADHVVVFQMLNLEEQEEQQSSML